MGGDLPESKGADLHYPTMRLAFPLAIALLLSIPSIARQAAPAIDRLDADGLTALMRASARGDVKAVNALLEKQASPDVRSDPFAVTALMCASFHGHVEIVRLLIAKGANVRLQDGTGAGAIDWAVVGSRPAAEALLKQSGAAMNPFLNIVNLPLGLMEKVAEARK
jgi:ankyrin repeat protein